MSTRQQKIKDRILIFILIILISLISNAKLQAYINPAYINPVNVGSLEKKTIISDYKIDFKIGNGMEVLYFEIINDGQMLFGYGYVKNISDKTIKDCNFGGGGLSGFTKEGTRLFNIGIGTGSEIYIKPNEVIPIYFSKHYGEYNEMLKYLDTIEFRKTYRYKKIKKIEGLYLNSMEYQVYINFEFINKTDDKFFKGSVLVMYYNENNEIIGWTRGEVIEAIVPNSSNYTNVTGTYLNNSFKGSEMGIKNNLIPFLKEKGSIKVFSRANISEEFKEEFNIRKKEISQ